MSERLQGGMLLDEHSQHREGGSAKDDMPRRKARDFGGLGELSQDEVAVIAAIRQTRYGETHVRTRDSVIVEIRREETIKPPSQQLALLGAAGSETRDN